MTPKEKAEELIEKYKDYVHGYVGSSMLTNHEYPEQILAQAKKVALIVVDEIIKSRPLNPNYVDWDDCGATHKYWYEAQKEEALKFWNDVIIEIKAM